MGKNKVKFQVKPTNKIEVPKSDNKGKVDVGLMAQATTKTIVSPSLTDQAQVKIKIEK